MTDHTHGPRAATVLAFRAAWQTTLAARAAWNALDPDDQEALLGDGDTPAALLVPRTLAVAEEYAHHAYHINIGRREDQE